MVEEAQGARMSTPDKPRPKPDDFDGPNPPQIFTDNVGNTWGRIPCPHCQTMDGCDCHLNHPYEG